MKILVDVMGGDNPPLELVRGVVDAAKLFDVELVILGHKDLIETEAKKAGVRLGAQNISIYDTGDTVITMEDAALAVVREKRDSSMGIGLRMLAAGEADALVSCGNTGALHAGSTLVVRRIKGLQRSAIASVLPLAKPTLLIDSGANTQVTPQILEQFAIMGQIYMRKMFSLERPEVGLLNNGAEEHKGNEVAKAAHVLLRDNPEINFVGNVEGKEVPFGKCDIIVTDGFTGNILLKTIEGFGKFLLGKLKKAFHKNLLTKASGLAMRSKLGALKKEFDADEYGGAPLLGISKAVIKAHGSSDAKAITNAIRQAIVYVNTGVIGEIAQYTMEAQAKQTASAGDEA